MSKTAFIVNGRKSVRKRFNHLLKKHRHLLQGEFNAVYTSDTGHGKLLAKELTNDGFSHIIAVGGDGTLHEVVNGVMMAEQRNSIVGLLPSGTANDYAKSLKASSNFPDVIKLINQHKSTPVNLGKIYFEKGPAEYFINIADMGLGVEVIQRVNKSARWFGSNLTFAKAILESFSIYKNKPLSIHADGWDWTGKINSVVVANGKYFGSGMCIAPEADHQGNDFAVVIIGDITIRDYLKHVRKIKKGEMIDHPEVQYQRATKIQISSDGQGIEADGEFIGSDPIEITLKKGSLNFLI